MLLKTSVLFEISCVFVGNSAIFGFSIKVKIPSIILCSRILGPRPRNSEIVILLVKFVECEIVVCREISCWCVTRALVLCIFSLAVSR